MSRFSNKPSCRQWTITVLVIVTGAMALTIVLYTIATTNKSTKPCQIIVENKTTLSKQVIRLQLETLVPLFLRPSTLHPRYTQSNHSDVREHTTMRCSRLISM